MKKDKMTWYDVTLGQFLKLQELLKIEDNEERIISLAQLLLGDSITELPITEFNKRIKELDFLEQEIPEAIPPKKVTVNNRKYYMDCLLGNISTAQYIDYTNFAKTNDISKMMAVFLIPDGHKYNDGYDMEQVFKDINDLPIVIVNNIAFFFERQLVKFMEIFQSYSIKRIKKTKMPKEQKEKVIKIIQESMDLVLSHLCLNSVK